ncbi:hypothetical protein C8Q80DRAFT_155919 [Daedaleopsis nitida]|nr:hypothetical protein C8Q80DRAFT_155919 [Daedaleopsis nitida]
MTWSSLSQSSSLLHLLHLYRWVLPLVSIDDLPIEVLLIEVISSVRPDKCALAACTLIYRAWLTELAVIITICPFRPKYTGSRLMRSSLDIKRVCRAPSSV